MLVEFLLSMNLCLVVDENLIPFTNFRPRSDSFGSNDRLLFIPSLMHDTSRPTSSDISRPIQFGWFLQCLNESEYFSTGFLHVLILQICYKYALAKSVENQLHRRCNVWTDGVLWTDIHGVQTLVEVVDNNHSVVLLMSCHKQSEKYMVSL